MAMRVSPLPRRPAEPRGVAPTPPSALTSTARATRRRRAPGTAPRTSVHGRARVAGGERRRRLRRVDATPAPVSVRGRARWRSPRASGAIDREPRLRVCPPGRLGRRARRAVRRHRADPVLPGGLRGLGPGRLPRPGTRRARARWRRARGGARRGGPKRSAAATATSGSAGRRGFFAADASAVTGWLFAARGLTHKLLALALAAFAWTVAGIGHLVVLALLALWTPLARASGRDATRLSAPLSFAAFGSPDRSGTGADRFGTGVDDRGDVSVRERDRASSRERSRIASGAFALVCAAALFLVLDSDDARREARG